ncbi:MAG: co-chaperone DjlA [Gammaproteobacteria bacterium]
MSWWGKVIGGTLGFMLGGPLGALLGASIGHSFDAGSNRLDWSQGADSGRVQAAFFTATFSVMGHIAKADGRVSEREIQMARAVMNHMNLGAAQKDAAIRLFSEGKRDDFPLDDVMQQFRRECGRRHDLSVMFLEIQIQAAMADGSISQAERGILERVGRYLGVSAFELQQLEALIRAQQRRHSGGQQAAAQVDHLAEAYQVLGVDSSTNDAEVKKAFRKLVSRHHPDKLIAKGLPEEMLKIAQEKTQEINASYDLIKESRGMK